MDPKGRVTNLTIFLDSNQVQVIVYEKIVNIYDNLLISIHIVTGLMDRLINKGNINLSL